MKLVNPLILAICFSFFCCSEIDSQVAANIQEIEALNFKVKATACIVLVRNSLESGNEAFALKIKNSKHDKSNSYNYVVTAIVDKCVSQISDAQINKILTPENVQVNLKEYHNLFGIDQIPGDLNNLVYTESMKKIDLIIEESNNTEMNENKLIDEEEIGLFGLKLGASGSFQNIGLLIGVFVTFILIAYGLTVLQNKHKQREEGNKKKKKKREENEDDK